MGVSHRDVAQSGSAPEWGSGGRRFKSSHPDQKIKDLRVPRKSFLLSGTHLVPTGNKMGGLCHLGSWAIALPDRGALQPAPRRRRRKAEPGFALPSWSRYYRGAYCAHPWRLSAALSLTVCIRLHKVVQTSFTVCCQRPLFWRSRYFPVPLCLLLIAEPYDFKDLRFVIISGSGRTIRLGLVG